MSLGQLSLWKVLVAVLLVVPPVAYVARDLSTATQGPAPRSAIVLPASGPAPTGPRIQIDKERPPKPGPDRTPRPTPTPTPTPTPSPTPGTHADGDCSDEERDDGVLVVHPCPDDVGDDDDDDDDERDDDGGGDDD